MYSRKVKGNVAKACSHNLRISVKNAKPVCKAVRGLELKRAKKFLSEVLKEKKSINGKYYSKATKEVLNIIETAEKNTEFKNLDLDRIYIAHIAALEGLHRHRRKRKRGFGTKIKFAHLEVILKERSKKLEKKDIKEEEKLKKAEKETKETKEIENKEQKPEEKRKEEIEKTKIEEKSGKEKKIEKTEKPAEKKEKPKETENKELNIKKTEKLEQTKKIEKRSKNQNSRKNKIN